MLDITAFLDPRFKDLDPFVATAHRVDVEEAVKLELLELAEHKDVIELEVSNADETDQPVDETSGE